MVEVKEVLRLWMSGAVKKAIAKQVGLDPKTVRSYIAAAEAAGLLRSEAGGGVSDELLAKTLTELRPSGGRPHGDACRQAARAALLQRGDKSDRSGARGAARVTARVAQQE